MTARVEYRELNDMVDTWHYANLTFRHYAKRLTLEHPRWEPLVVAASLDGAPVGLGLAQPEAGTNWAELLSLSVAEKLRGQGVATELLRRVEAACLARGIDTLYGHYMSGEDSTAAVERVLEKRAFSVPVPRMLAVRCSLVRPPLERHWLRRLHHVVQRRRRRGRPVPVANTSRRAATVSP